MYLHVLENDPDIHSVWLTKDEEVFRRLHAQNKPVCHINSLKGFWLTARAGVAFTDHFRCTDWNNTGVSYRTRIVQLWHGVGLKNFKGFPRVTFRGLRYSDD